MRSLYQHLGAAPKKRGGGQGRANPQRWARHTCSRLLPRAGSWKITHPETHSCCGMLSGEQGKGGGRTRVDPVQLRAPIHPLPASPAGKHWLQEGHHPWGCPRSTRAVKEAAGVAKSLNCSSSSKPGSGRRTKAPPDTGRDRPSAAERRNRLAGFSTEYFPKLCN